MAYHGELPSMNEEGTVLRRSSDEGRTWSEAKPISPDNGNAHAANNACFRRLKSGRLVLSSREYIDGVRSIPSTGDILAIWCRGLTGRTPLNSAVSRDGGKTWSPVKLLDRSEYHGYGYTSVDYMGGRVVITTMRYPLFSSIERFQVQPGYTDMLFLSLPVEWFYRMPERGGTLLPATP